MAQFNVRAPPPTVTHSSTASPEIVWKRASFMESAYRYRKLVNLLVSNARYARKLSSVIDSTDMDAFAAVLVNIFLVTGGTVPFIKSLLEDEFSKVTHDSKGALLRGTGILIKYFISVLTFVGKVGQEYVRTVMGDVINQIVLDPELSLEVDPRKIEAAGLDADDNVDDIVATNMRLLQDTAQIFIDRISAPEMIAAMPREIRAICYYTAEGAKKYAPEHIMPLVGGFIMLRFFSPAVATPETWGLLGDAAPSIKARRNLILLTKVLQGISNNIPFGSKEEYMASLNPWVEVQARRLVTYFQQVITDPLARPGTQPFADQAEWKNKETFDQRDIHQLDLQDLFELHRLIWQRSTKFIVSFNLEKADERDAAADKEFISFIAELGPPPTLTKRRASSVLAEPSSGPASPTPDDTSSSLIDTSALDSAKFLYSSGQTKEGWPVVYLVVHRLRLEFLQNINMLITHIFKIFESIIAANAKYALVVDMSWSRITTDMKTNIYGYVSQLSTAFPRTLKKNVGSVYIIHPSAYTKAIIFFMKAFTSKKLIRKIHELYNWKDLTKYIDLEKIALPESSRDYITKAYKVTKVNAKGKSQSRVVKFTQNSLLNIDPKTKRVKNEKPLNEIEEVSTHFKSAELFMTFLPEATKPKPKSGPTSIFSSAVNKIKEDPVDALSRKYLCSCQEDRDDIIEDLFTFGFKSDSVTAPQEFKVVKVNQAGKHQERVFKMTCDSLLNLDGQKIKSEIGFAGIESVDVDTSDHRVLWLRFKGEDFKRQIICSMGEANHLFKALREGMQRYRHNEDSEMQRDVQAGAEFGSL